MSGVAEVFNGRFLRRIQQGGNPLTLTSWTLNFAFLDGTWKFGNAVAHEAGLYEWINGNYSRVQGRVGDRGYSVVLVYQDITDGSIPPTPTGGTHLEGILIVAPPGGWALAPPQVPQGIVWVAQGFAGSLSNIGWRNAI